MSLSPLRPRRRHRIPAAGPEPWPQHCSRPERRIDDLAPVPLLSLGSHLATNYQPGNRRMVSEYQHRAGLAFSMAQRAYGKRDGERIRHPADDELQLIARQPQAEQALRKQLEQLGFRPALRQSLALPKESAEMFQLPGEEAWIRFVPAAAGAASPGLADRHSPGLRLRPHRHRRLVRRDRRVRGGRLVRPRPRCRRRWPAHRHTARAPAPDPPEPSAAHAASTGPAGR